MAANQEGTSIGFQVAVAVSVEALQGNEVQVPIEKSDIEAGWVEVLGMAALRVRANDDWQMVASVAVARFPAGASLNPLVLEIKNRQSGEFIAGGGLVQAGGAGNWKIPVDGRLNLSAPDEALAGLYVFVTTYTITGN